MSRPIEKMLDITPTRTVFVTPTPYENTQMAHDDRRMRGNYLEWKVLMNERINVFEYSITECASAIESVEQLEQDYPAKVEKLKKFYQKNRDPFLNPLRL